MDTELVVEHTIADIPKVTGMVLDVGCRAFDFSHAMIKKGYKMVCIEADSEVKPKHHWNLSFGNYALVPRRESGKEHRLYTFGNGTANHLSTIKGAAGPHTKSCLVMGLSILEIGKKFGAAHWDVVKLDCEGAEYEVLLDWPGPIAEQITVEFHEHTGANIWGSRIYDDILKHLGQWYIPVQHELSLQHGIKTLNYWDSLFVLKGLH